MERLRRHLLSISTKQLALLLACLAIPALLLNLGKMAFIGDEAIRTLVAFEMKHSGNFIVPTLSGQEYYNKPPLYNWCIYISSMVAGHFGEWPTRLTTLVFLILFAYTVYRIICKQFDTLTALTMAFMLLTSGRILFWDSMLGLIDICFSWIVYLNMMILYTLAKAGRWKAMFITSYLLFSVAFLLKGLPAVVFQGISILTALQLHGVFRKKIFSADHWIGIGIGIVPLVTYYVVFAASVDLSKVFSVLFDQSMQRTATHHGLGKTIAHVFTFPFEQTYHFLPWSLLVAMTFYPGFMARIRSNDFVRFNFWMLVTNLPVYWLSVQVYPRYVLMFIPMFNLVGYFILDLSRVSFPVWWKVFRGLFIGLTALAWLGTLGMPFAAQVRVLPAFWMLWLGGSVVIGFALAGLIWDGNRSFLWMAMALLAVRCVFDLVVLPLRSQQNDVNVIRDDCHRVAVLHKDQKMQLYKETFTHQVARCYLSLYTDQIIPYTDTAAAPEVLYLVDRTLYPEFPGIQVDSVRIEMNGRLALMQLNP